ncbi:MAG: hypothetical protein A3J47_03220 [Candidatus Yanofskybacteria bacterium RIFCSPHIGHO2_02_FULL_43_22]|uniref:Bacterial spore germination immunoglobulin-like domain-containing protein n=1 Tax=Candidatus Yanofskybacteria bacterium RIFCSPHIGHO2_02_FULL_43_22 TaxID=1802681 RepID=A0A1F8FMZ0_9BACT|nr:MAG: hypothetical protein A3J47_03220 [Candidatus Yanofskybacteria bacterium RIFCSPHIGHO2_02_FULL_43_22]
MKKSLKIVFITLLAVVMVDVVWGIYGQDIPADIAEHIKSKSDLIVVDEPGLLETITSPLTVRGKARGLWYFEASFPIILTDWDGRIIAQWYATAQNEWMTEDFVPFEGKLEFESPVFKGTDKDHFSRRGYLIFKKDNPSGLPEHDDALEIPIRFD